MTTDCQVAHDIDNLLLKGSITVQHAHGGGMCQLEQPWLRLLVSPLPPHLLPLVLLGVLRPQSTDSEPDASVHCQRMTIALLVLEGYSHSR